jgi:hypothetical protein
MTDTPRHIDLEDAMADYTAKLAEAGRRIHPSWGVTGYKAFETRDGVAFSCTLTANGGAVADVEQGGHGGPTDLYWTTAARADGTMDRFLAEAASVFPDDQESDATAVEALLMKAGL